MIANEFEAFLARAWPRSPLQSRGRTKPPKTVPFDARKELVSGACFVAFAGLGQLNTGQIYFAQVNFALVRQLPSTHSGLLDSGHLLPWTWPWTWS